MSNLEAVAAQIAEQSSACRVKLVTSLPDNWINKLLDVTEADKRFTHIPVNREEAAVDLCSGVYRNGAGFPARPACVGHVDACDPRVRVRRVTTQSHAVSDRLTASVNRPCPVRNL